MTDRNIENLIPRGPYHPPAPDIEPIYLDDEPVSESASYARWLLIAVAVAIAAGLGLAFWP